MASFRLTETADELGTWRYPYDRYLTEYLGQNVVCYMSCPNRKGSAPLVLYIQGSDPSSHFFRGSDGQIKGYDHDLLMEALASRSVCLLVVEKPQTAFLWQSKFPGTARGTTMGYKRSYTCQRWVGALRAAVEGAWTLPKIDPSRTLVIGHSEGSQVAAHLSAALPQIAAAACLAGSDFTPGVDAPTDAQCAERNDLRLLGGHTLRYWRSWRDRPMSAALLSTHARLYLAHGRNDSCSNFAAFERTVADLVGADRPDVTVDVGNYDHGLNLPGQVTPQGKRVMFRKVLDWSGFWE